MKVTFLIYSALAVVANAAVADRVSFSTQQKPQQQFSPRFNFFDVELLRYTADTIPGNFMVSPASVKSALAMLLEGAHGSCADELRRTLRLPEDPAAIRNQLHSFLASLQVQTPGVTIESANRIFLANNLTPRPEYQQLLKSVYFSEVQLVDFARAQQTADFINNWIKTTTHGLIPTLVDPGNFEASSVLLLANALYFKGVWENAFDESLTSNKCFKKMSGCVQTPMMENQAEFNYGNIEELHAQAVELPYQGGKYSMLILLPNENNGVSSLVKDLPFISLPQILAAMESTDVQLTMPRFTVDFTGDLIPILQNVGIREVFGSRANLSGIIGITEQSPQVNNVMHRTRIEVNEVGSIAAAATGAMIVPLMGSTTARMNVDHPFLFFIRDVQTGAILFEGRVNEPENLPVSDSSEEEDYSGLFQQNGQSSGQGNTRPQAASIPNRRPVPLNPTPKPASSAYQPQAQGAQPAPSSQQTRGQPDVQNYQYNSQSQSAGAADRFLPDPVYYPQATNTQQVRGRPVLQALNNDRYYAQRPFQPTDNRQYYENAQQQNGKIFPKRMPVSLPLSTMSHSLPPLTLAAQNVPLLPVYPARSPELSPQSIMVMDPVYYESESYSNHLSTSNNDAHDLQKTRSTATDGRSVPVKQDSIPTNRMDSKFQQPFPKDNDGIRFTL